MLNITDGIWNGTIQAGFAAFAVMLLLFAAWLVLQIVKLARATHAVIQANTEAIARQTTLLGAIAADSENLRDQGTHTQHAINRLCIILEKRPCLLDERTAPHAHDHRP